MRIVLSDKRGLIQAWERNMITFFFEYLPLWAENTQVTYLCQLKMYVTNIAKYWWFFLATLKLVLKFHYQNGKRGCMFFVVHRTVFSWFIKMHKLICCNLSWHCSVPHVLVSAQIGFTEHWCSVGAKELGWASGWRQLTEVQPSGSTIKLRTCSLYEI